MPIYMEIEGIKGTVKAERPVVGANFAFADGSVRNSGQPGGGPRVVVYDGSNGSASSSGDGRILVSRIALPNSPNGAIDALAPNAVAGARTLFEAQRSMVTALGVVFAVAPGGANKLRCPNNLRQIALAAGGPLATLRFFITDGGNRTGVMVELENCLITNYSLSGHGGAATAQTGELFKASLVGAGKKVTIAFCK